MARRYKTRTKSTKSKTYQDYLEMRRERELKGYVLKSEMTKSQFENFYTRLKLAKKNGEIKSQPWQELKVRETYLSPKQATALSKASKEMKVQGLINKSYSANALRKQATSQTVFYIAQFLSANKGSLFTGNYE